MKRGEHVAAHLLAFRVKRGAVDDKVLCIFHHDDGTAVVVVTTVAIATATATVTATARAGVVVGGDSGGGCGAVVVVAVAGAEATAEQVSRERWPRSATQHVHEWQVTSAETCQYPQGQGRAAVEI